MYKIVLHFAAFFAITTSIPLAFFHPRWAVVCLAVGVGCKNDATMREIRQVRKEAGLSADF